VSAHRRYSTLARGPVETWDLGDLGTRRVLLMVDPDGMGLELIQRPPYPSETAPTAGGPHRAQSPTQSDEVGT
jgi:hypothetical protein